MKKLFFLILSVCFSVLIVFFAFYYEISPFFELAEKTDDINYSISKKKPFENIVFAAVDEKSVNIYGRWPWKRDILAKGIKKLGASSAVLLDMTFSEKTEKQYDKSLADSIFSSGNIICGFFLRDKASEDLEMERKKILSLSTLERIYSKNLEIPHADYAEASIKVILQACALNGAFSTFHDKDGIFRRYPLGFVYDGSVYPSLGIQGLRFYLNKDIEIKKGRGGIIGEIGDDKISFGKNGMKRLNFYNPDSYKIISFSDLVETDKYNEFIKNKIVILGITEAGVSDIRSTPLGAIPGPLLHYTFLSNVLSGELIKERKIYTGFLIFLMGILPFFMVFISKKVFFRTSFNLIFLFCFIFISKILYIYSNIWIDNFFPSISLVLSMFLLEVILFKYHENESLFIKEAFAAYVSPVVLKKLAENPEKLTLGGEEKELTTLFLDIRDFTTISEALDSTSLVNLLKELFNPLTGIIQKNNGYVDKYIGDAIMAFYNAPVDIENHAEMACKTALEMMRLMKSEELKKNLKTDFNVKIGVGINTGPAVIGNTGAHNRFNYTAIGDSVNLASRLQDLNKTYKTSILISEFTKKEAGDKFLTRKIEEVMVKGKTKGVFVYELMEKNDINLKIKEMFEHALETGLKEDFDKCFNETGDRVSMIFSERYI
ncbi:MAG: adenylate/guanylate cyclase domain-containing protein [Deltaproteobacteria bacterium]|nr:MAG: adenylate/guanylate cyclase domain-containing protein [Deltaproteobacteria bacterium]PIE74983.1 MAG: adenylate/guanylate cyclase domain-containing protein [Deltaproteobacteria bacterium]